MSDRSRRSRWRLLAGLLVVLLVLGVVGWLLIDPSAIATRVKDKAVAEASQRLGRRVEAGPVHVHLLPLGASLERLSVAGGNGEPPLLTVKDTSVSLHLWPLLRSRGQDVQISAITLKDIELNLVRRANGTWSYEDIGGSSETPPPTASEPAKRPDIVVSDFRVENAEVKVIDLTAKGQSAVSLSQIDLSSHDIGLEKPLTVEWDAAFASDKQNLSGTLSIDRLPASAAALRTSGWPQVSGKLSLKGAALKDLKELLPVGVARMFAGGTAGADLAVSTSSAGNYALDGVVKLDAPDVQGEPAHGSLGLHATVSAENPAKTMAASIDDLKLRGRGIDLQGKASLTSSPRRGSFAIEGPLLELDSLLLTSNRPVDDKPRPIIPPSMRTQAERIQVSGTIQIKELRSGKLRAHDLDAQAKLDRGVLTLTKATVGLYTGRATLTGTTLNLNEKKPTWNARMKFDAVDLQTALREVTGLSPASGLLSGELALVGAGNDWAELINSLAGKGALSLASGALNSVDLGADIAKPLAVALRTVGLGAAADKVPATGQTKLEDLAATFDVQSGALSFQEPLRVKTPFGGLELIGKIGLDHKLAMTGVARLSQSFLDRMGAGKLASNGFLNVPLNLGGTLEKPGIEGVDWGGVAQSALTGALQQKGKDSGKSLMDEAQKRLQDLLRGT